MAGKRNHLPRCIRSAGIVDEIVIVTRMPRLPLSTLMSRFFSSVDGDFNAGL